mmetsp:Transcript_414/g.588  ORF Transcript_414/g.588 Transcript_414/m.588 type:complete len:687 (-) Transcript_414:43-2103(-)
MSAKIADISCAKEKADKEFRRSSIDAGQTENALFNIEDLRKISLKDFTKAALATSNHDYSAVADAFIDTVKSCIGNLENTVHDFLDEMLPEENIVAREILLALAPKIKPALKLSRIGLATRMMLSVCLTYLDVTTDFLVLKEYGVGGEITRKFFYISVGVLLWATLINVILASIANKKRSKRAKVWAMFVALMQLNPLVHGLNTWRGVEQREEDVLSPFLVFLIVRFCELIFEVMPETVLQLYVSYHTKTLSNTVTFSILSSVASAAFIMTDNSIMSERNVMSKQKRGPHSHPNFGFIPNGLRGQIALQLGLFLFYGGYLACAMLTLSVALTAIYWVYVPLVMFCEFMAFLGARASRGEIIVSVEAPGEWITSFFMHLGGYLMMCVAPGTQLRIDDGAPGGRHYSAMIFYRLLSCTIIIIRATNMFPGTDSIDSGARIVHTKAETVRLYFFIALGVTILGGILILVNVPKSHRWTFYESRWTGPKFWKWCFEASQLVDGADTKDEQKVFVWLFVHSSYLDKEAVKEWLLGLKSDGKILGGGDKKLPKGCGDFSGHSLESFFTKTFQRFAYYGDAESTAEVHAHLESLQSEVAARPMSNKSSRKSMMAEKDPEEDKDTDEDDDEDGQSNVQKEGATGDELTIEKLRISFAEMAASNADKDKAIAKAQANEKKMVEEIERLRQALNER